MSNQNICFVNKKLFLMSNQNICFVNKYEKHLFAITTGWYCLQFACL